MAISRLYLFVFENNDAARRFVKRLALNLPEDFAALIHDDQVQVIDAGSRLDYRERIMQLAHSSSARNLIVKP
jgi:hypothetical protein